MKGATLRRRFMQHGRTQFKFPPIGLRIVKSALGVFLCFLIYFLRGQKGMPFYSALAVLWCIQAYTKNTVKNAIQRTIGTMIGAVYGLIFILCKMYVIDFGFSVLHYLCLSLMIIPIIYTSILFNRKNASYFSCVVYLSIVVNHLADVNPYLFVLDRVTDTMIGILLGLIINSFHLPRTYRKDILFAADLDNALTVTKDKLTPYSRVMLNMLLEQGMSFTIMTLRTPASLLDSVSDINLRLPIIAMDGAVLYDTKENRYIRTFVISPENAGILYQLLTSRGFHVFSNVILEDLLIIYYSELQNPAEKAIFQELRRSPYRNYLNKERPATHPVVYFMSIDTTERIEALYTELEQNGYTSSFKVLHYPSDDYPGYSYIKIYNRNASVKNMLDYLMRETGLQKLITVSDNHSRYDVMYSHHDSNHIIRLLKKLYSPVIFSKNAVTEKANN